MIKIICCGKIKEDYLKQAIADYSKRITKYSKIQIIELKDSDIETEKIEILKHIDKKDYIICLSIEGDSITSEALALKIDSIFITHPNVTFIIGGSAGISNEIKKLSNYNLSFSKLTFPHQLFRVVLLEQIYRSFKINNNESYHK